MRRGSLPEPFHVGISVPDLERAMAELGGAVALHWAPPRTTVFGPWPLRVAFSIEGPPYIELIEAETGAPWRPVADEHVHHLGYWSSDHPADSRRLRSLGLATVMDGARFGVRGFSCHRLSHAPLWIELIDPAIAPNWRSHINAR